MELLLDTHTLLWFVENDKKLSEKARINIANLSNSCSVSIACIWEMSIKISTGKLRMKQSFKELYERLNENNFEILPITFEHTRLVSELEFHHRDPFDRLIIAQAQAENMTIVTNDSAFKEYSVELLW